VTGQFVNFSLRSIKGTYFWSLEETQQASWVTLLADYFTTDQPYEIYRWLGGAPAMSQWQGERVRDALGDYDLTVVTDKYDATLAFDVDDMRRDKTGQILRRIAEMGQKAATLPQRLFTTLLEDTSATAYDGSTFFANSHNVGTVDNLLAPGATTPAAPTSAEMQEAVMESIQAMVGFLDDTGDPCNEFATSFGVMVPTNMYQALTAALRDTFTSAGVSNTLISAQSMGMTITPIINPRLTGTTSFYTFRTDAPVKSCIWQEEDIGAESFKTLGMDSDNAFWRDEVAFGAKRIAAASLGRFELITKSTFA